eukprot:m.131590 g.131590  ORF g.131590 m.131590 type:complete len:59 (+) comp14628_c0_seq6:127-303(+)
MIFKDFIVLQTKEVTLAKGDVFPGTETLITVFDSNGKFYLNPPFQSVGDLKFEGLDFI